MILWWDSRRYRVYLSPTSTSASNKKKHGGSAENSHNKGELRQISAFYFFDTVYLFWFFKISLSLCYFCQITAVNNAGSQYIHVLHLYLYKYIAQAETLELGRIFRIISTWVTVYPRVYHTINFKGLFYFLQDRRSRPGDALHVPYVHNFRFSYQKTFLKRQCITRLGIQQVCWTID